VTPPRFASRIAGPGLTTPDPRAFGAPPYQGGYPPGRIRRKKKPRENAGFFLPTDCRADVAKRASDPSVLALSALIRFLPRKSALKQESYIPVTTDPAIG